MTKCSAVVLLAFAAALIPHAGPAATLTGDGTPKRPYDSGAWTSVSVVARPMSPLKMPADVYFGRFKFSNLEVRNTVHDLRIQGVSPLAIQQQRFHIEEALEALAAWMDEYPLDPWLPGTILGLADQMHARAQPDYDLRSLFLLYYLSEHFHGHYFGQQADARLNGFAPAPNDDITTTFDPYFPANLFWDAIYPGIRKM